MPCAVITGVTGQDGSYLAELLVAEGFEVHGVSRSQNAAEHPNLSDLVSRAGVLNSQLFLYSEDIRNADALRNLLLRVQPDEIYHLAAQSHAGRSFTNPEETAEVNGIATVRLLEIARHLSGPPRFFHASSSEVFGSASEPPQNEETPFNPVTPYGCSKAFATQMTRVYRKSFGLFAVNGILFNHESPRRPESFVTQKICKAAARIKLGLQQDLVLGALNTKRDWGDARDYVRGIRLAMKHSTPEDFVFASGTLHSVEDVIRVAFNAVELDWTKYIRQDQQFIRPEEPAYLSGDFSKARRLLNWQPTTSFARLITEMTHLQGVSQ